MIGLRFHLNESEIMEALDEVMSHDKNRAVRTGANRLFVRDHLASCAACQVRLRLIREGRILMDSLPVEAPPSYLAEQTLVGVRRAMSETSGSLSYSGARWNLRPALSFFSFLGAPAPASVLAMALVFGVLMAGRFGDGRTKESEEVGSLENTLVLRVSPGLGAASGSGMASDGMASDKVEPAQSPLKNESAIVLSSSENVGPKAADIPKKMSRESELAQNVPSKFKPVEPVGQEKSFPRQALRPWVGAMPPSGPGVRAAGHVAVGSGDEFQPRDELQPHDEAQPEEEEVEKHADLPPVQVFGNRIRPDAGEKVRLKIRTEIPGSVRIDIFNASGVRASRLAEGVLPAGIHEFTWGAKTLSGQIVASGIYVIVIQAPGLRDEIKVVVLR